ncbi:hypothetical protein PLESTB_000635200 [Pleodorina starrii]|uniref:Uncharacterized protein n=1 Tax=Pleodorina starrii TaxID=330485 RepID=A0A9W6BI01_9CHLO|nr:hypothetical protein PLESTB_000635200 [Pleodorina starrii]GLC71492.1 hypothetical protein PLESTF_001127600 [Pleodorina starrii]
MPTSCFKAVREREQGLPRHLSAVAATFRAEVSSSASLIHRMELQRTLDGHGGCVNTVSFNPAGDLLVSGSDDQSVMLWDWRRGVRRLRFEPGHDNNIFQARLLPGSDDKTLVSCAADGQVRVSYFREGSSRPFAKRIHQHMGRAHKLALQHASPYDPSYGVGGGGGGPPCFYSSGEDGDVCFFDLRVSDAAPLGRMAAAAAGWPASGGGGGSSSAGPGRQRPRKIIDLNAVHVNPARPWQLVVGGADEAVVVYDNRALTSLTSSYVSSGSPSPAAAGSGGGGGRAAARRRVDGRPLMELCPAHLRVGGSASGPYRPTHVTCVMFGQNGDVLATYNDDDVYLFRPPGTQGSGGGRGRPGSRGDSDSDADGAEGTRRRGLRTAGGSRNGGSGSGAAAAASSGRRLSNEDADHGCEEEDDDSFLRPSRRRRRAGGSAGGGAADAAAAASVAAPTASGRAGESAAATAAADSGDYVIGRYSGHRNNRTVKGINFLGERQEWVVSGSDDGHVYIWSRDTCRLHAWLRGDTHVVNCLEPHPCLPLHLATSGIDDDIKLWAPTSEEPHAPGPAAEATMRANERSRSAAFSRTAGGRRVVLSRAMLQMLLGDLARRNDDGDGDNGDGADPAAPHRRLREMLLAALAGNNDEEDDDEEEEEDGWAAAGGDDDHDEDNEEEEEEEEEEGSDDDEDSDEEDGEEEDGDGGGGGTGGGMGDDGDDDDDSGDGEGGHGGQGDA